VQIQSWTGNHLKSCNDFGLVDYLVMTNVAGQYGLSRLDLLMSEVRAVFVPENTLCACVQLLLFSIKNSVCNYAVVCVIVITLPFYTYA